MPIVTIEIPLTIDLTGPLHIGTGYGRGLLNRTVVRTGQGHVYLPGSSLRGILRDTCEQLARSLELYVCAGPAARDMCGGREWASSCFICRLFGSPGRASGLIVDEAYLREDLQAALSIQDKDKRITPFGQTIQRTQVQLSRLRGLAREGRLFSSEFAVEGLVFVTTLSGILELTPVDPDQTEDIEGQYIELIMLLSAIKLVNHLGGGRRRGAGACTILLPDQIRVERQGGQSRQIKVSHLLEMVEWLELYAQAQAR
jgi:CRISPR/Cas system CSM-associated protein Csm3 (group 7 of RAMP superfamily)